MGKRIGTPKQASLVRRIRLAELVPPSGEYRLAGPNQQVIADLRHQRILFVLKPDKLGFQVADTLLETTHLVDHAEIGPADVAE
jgi:hypothetical protein